jgi:FkbM family methyltransferase
MLQHLYNESRDVLAITRILSLSDRLRFASCVFRNLRNIAVNKSLKTVDQCMSRNCFRVKAFGKSFILFNPDFALVREIYAWSIYFPSRHWIPSVGDLAIDLGANSGLFTLLCANLGCDVIAVEAQSGFVSSIRSHLSANGCETHARIIHGLIASQTGVFASPINLKLASHYCDAPKPIEMSDLIALTEGRTINLLKIDIEGSEFALFQGDLAWVDSVQRIAMEIHPQFGDVRDLVAKLERHGFSCELRSSRREVGDEISKYLGLCYAER